MRKLAKTIRDGHTMSFGYDTVEGCFTCTMRTLPHGSTEVISTDATSRKSLKKAVQNAARQLRRKMAQNG